jgi:hypothetical protein
MAFGGYLWQKQSLEWAAFDDKSVCAYVDFD